jgi:hypothetical protein
MSPLIPGKTSGSSTLQTPTYEKVSSPTGVCLVARETVQRLWGMGVVNCSTKGALTEEDWDKGASTMFPTARSCLEQIAKKVPDKVWHGVAPKRVPKASYECPLTWKTACSPSTKAARMSAPVPAAATTF